jgi:hypothetical protein
VSNGKRKGPREHGKKKKKTIKHYRIMISLGKMENKKREEK